MEARWESNPFPTLIPGDLLIPRYAKNVENAESS
jgi:hypothetical protein